MKNETFQSLYNNLANSHLVKNVKNKKKVTNDNLQYFETNLNKIFRHKDNTNFLKDVYQAGILNNKYNFLNLFAGDGQHILEHFEINIPQIVCENVDNYWVVKYRPKNKLSENEQIEFFKNYNEFLADINDF